MNKYLVIKFKWIENLGKVPAKVYRLGASNDLDLRILESIHDRKPIFNDKESAFNLQIIK